MALPSDCISGSRGKPCSPPGASLKSGAKVLLALAPGTKEDTGCCRECLRDLKARRMNEPILIVSDGAPGLIRAIEEVFPRSLRQRRLAHKIRNLAGKVPEERWREVKANAMACYQAASPMVARLLKEEFVTRYERELPSAVACFLDDFESCIAHLRLPIAHRRVIRTTNLLERLFGEERRRTKVIPHAFGERAVLKLMYAALIRASQTWKKIVISDFELKQIA
ncbi:MAG: IS256 family transposase, partial [Burkholderiales bacterium]